MAGRLSNVASRIMGGNGVVSRSVASSLRLRSGMGLPVGEHLVPDKPVPVNDELVWDNGTPFPEPCIDRIADTVGKYEALAWLCGGLGFFVSLGMLAVLNDKPSKIPFILYIFCSIPDAYGDTCFLMLCRDMSFSIEQTPKVYPYDNLRVELGGEP
ncbi:NADH dehydrogenase [ubiquinone] 1 beta subcomplex subunit 8, mitochondrial [Morella rubra]|uniref:NADH dehydrogenase [ubiquinone] 1 beta subcomplex subunit 8, mitochondrial n=1 Tax=Morella rubra TaxID=262757 RepID=A0A6A1VVS0_9ROSI|nr:NADH dehydrogenase [ubiquinone] 1 beta subcomplex subunit 8, mitochondrial [Morella rubra]